MNYILRKHSFTLSIMLKEYLRFSFVYIQIIILKTFIECINIVTSTYKQIFFM